MSKPLKINFESSTACNARCVFCPRYDMTRPMGEMSDDLFHKIIKEGKEWGVYTYSPFMNGDPFVFPRIWSWLDYMEKEGVRVNLYTNGQYIDVERLVKYKNINYLDFSINAATAETHKKLMRSPDFEVVKKNYFKARELAPFMVRASMVTVEANKSEIPAFKEMFKRTEICQFSNWTGDRSDPLAKTGERKPCYVLFHQMFILWDGRVVPCCMDYNGKQILGDANTKHIRDIWADSEWMRDKHRKYEFDTPVCVNCNYNVPSV